MSIIFIEPGVRLNLDPDGEIVSVQSLERLLKF
jgi:hypothetical protein